MSAVSGFLREYLTVLIVAGVGLGFTGLLIGVGSLLRPSNPSVQKSLNYESGVDPVGAGWAQSHVRYYVYALLFVLFDVEAVFIFPWATRLEVYGLFGLVEMLIFIFILALGLAYAWRKNVLRWA